MSRSAGESVREAEMEVGELEELTVSRRERERLESWRSWAAGCGKSKWRERGCWRRKIWATRGGKSKWRERGY